MREQIDGCSAAYPYVNGHCWGEPTLHVRAGSRKRASLRVPLHCHSPRSACSVGSEKGRQVCVHLKRETGLSTGSTWLGLLRCLNVTGTGRDELIVPVYRYCSRSMDRPLTSKFPRTIFGHGAVIHEYCSLRPSAPGTTPPAPTYLACLLP